MTYCRLSLLFSKRLTFLQVEWFCSYTVFVCMCICYISISMYPWIILCRTEKRQCEYTLFSINEPCIIVLTFYHDERIAGCIESECSHVLLYVYMYMMVFCLTLLQVHFVMQKLFVGFYALWCINHLDTLDQSQAHILFFHFFFLFKGPWRLKHQWQIYFSHTFKINHTHTQIKHGNG